MTTASHATLHATRGRRRRGFATVVALGLIAILGVTLGVLAVSFAADVRRSTRQAEDAQLRQLLLAGEVVVRDAIGRDGGAVKGDVALPESLAGMTLAYEQVSRDDGRAEFRVTARGAGGRSTSQALTYVRANGRWELRDAAL